MERDIKTIIITATVCLLAFLIVLYFYSAKIDSLKASEASYRDAYNGCTKTLFETIR